jgi:methylmalonyl-CoA/ethylmalonyl-CoA epimerase
VKGENMASQTKELIGMKPHHVGISVPDLEASIAWYCNVLGFVVTRRGYVEAAHAKNAFLKNGDFYIEIFQPEKPVPQPDNQNYPPMAVATIGTRHIAYSVQDLKKVTEMLKKKGVDIAMERPDGTVHFIRDNSGILVEFMPEW